MVSTRKKRQSNSRLVSQLDDFDQDVIIGYAMSNRQEYATVNESTADQEFTVGNSDGDPSTNENVIVKTSERCFIEKIDKEMGSFVDTVEDKIQNATSTAIDNIITLKIELAVWSIKAISGRYATSVMASSECGENIGVTVLF